MAKSNLLEYINKYIKTSRFSASSWAIVVYIAYLPLEKLPQETISTRKALQK